MCCFILFDLLLVVSCWLIGCCVVRCLLIPGSLICCWWFHFVLFSFVNSFVVLLLHWLLVNSSSVLSFIDSSLMDETSFVDDG